MNWIAMLFGRRPGEPKMKPEHERDQEFRDAERKSESVLNRVDQAIARAMKEAEDEVLGRSKRR